MAEGTGGSTSVSNVTFGQVMPTSGVIAPTRVGWNFMGYFQNAGGVGRQFYNPDMSATDQIWDIDLPTVQTLHAHWTRKIVTVTFDRQGGTGGNDSVANVQYGLAMPGAGAAPTRVGFNFQGYFTQINGAGTKYYNADMSSAGNWLVDTNTNQTLYAHWVV
jgi:hypothetical protein